MSEQPGVFAAGGFGPPPGGYGPPGGGGPGGFGGPPGGGGPGGFGGPPGGGGPGGFGGPPGGGGPGGFGGPPPGAPPGAPPGGYGPPPGGYGTPPGYGAPMASPGGGPMLGGPPGAGPHEQLKKDATTWLIISAVSFFFCNSCCLGLIGAVMCFLAMQAADQGNIADAEAKLKWGKILSIAGVVLGVLLVVAYFLYAFVFAAASAVGGF